jgi:Rps23 Pro-64 3,4-dihydroxylase Tpa1-like proline 4-hydroxylase
MARPLFALNPDLARTDLARSFARDGRLQVRDFLTRETALELRSILAERTPWGVALHAQGPGNVQPQSFRAEELRDRAKAEQLQRLVRATNEAAAQGRYAFRSLRYSLVEAYLGNWDPGGPHDLLLEHLNAPEFMGFMRQVTGIEALVKADAHASCYGPQHFLGRHVDSHLAEGWRVAYVLNLTIDDWQPDWGGYLVFYDEDGDIVAGYRPRFNTLNLFLVPVPHAVSYVPPFAPNGRYAISGWLRDR